mmetsp:Transcript_5778/g.17898  ORF Transcript_5778/g.17898 Transcript_5778/m.17898 type:complete len:177 (+) Transcript_5778:1439-1969(+)
MSSRDAAALARTAGCPVTLSDAASSRAVARNTRAGRRARTASLSTLPEVLQTAILDFLARDRLRPLVDDELDHADILKDDVMERVPRGAYHVDELGGWLEGLSEHQWFLSRQKKSVKRWLRDASRLCRVSKQLKFCLFGSLDDVESLFLSLNDLGEELNEAITLVQRTYNDTYEPR